MERNGECRQKCAILIGFDHLEELYENADHADWQQCCNCGYGRRRSGGGGEWSFCYYHVCFVHEREIYHVNYSVGALDIRSEHVYPSVAPLDRVSCNWGADCYLLILIEEYFYWLNNFQFYYTTSKMYWYLHLDRFTFIVHLDKQNIQYSYFEMFIFPIFISEFYITLASAYFPQVLYWNM